MAIFPIPAQYIATGTGPNQIAIRDANGSIPGVPIIFHRSTTDDVANLVREVVASGFLRGGAFKSTLEVVPFSENKLYFDTRGIDTEVVVNGYRIMLQPRLTSIDMGIAPASGERKDLVFMEVWFQRNEEGGRTVQWRLRVAADADRLDSPEVKAMGPNGVLLETGYVKDHPAFPHLKKDPGIWVSLGPGLVNDPLAEIGVDNNIYRVIYAVPLAVVRRINRAAFNPVSNPNGGSFYSSVSVSNRPDSLWHNAIDINYQVVDLRSTCSFNFDKSLVLKRGILDFLMQRLETSGKRNVRVSRLLQDYGSRFTEVPNTAPFYLSLPVNMVRNSHFKTVSPDDDNMAAGWTKYGAGAGTFTFTPGSLTLERTTELGIPCGIEAEIPLIDSNHFTLSVSYTIVSASADATLLMVLNDGETDVIHRVTLSSKPIGVNVEVKTFIGAGYKNSLKVRLYTSDAACKITFNAVDIKGDYRALPIQEISDDGRSISIDTPKSGLFNIDNATIYDTVSKSLLPAQMTLTGSKLSIAFSSAPSSRDLRLDLSINYKEGNWLPYTAEGSKALFKEFIQAFDQEGFAGFVLDSNTEPNQLASNSVGYVVGPNEKVLSYNALNATTSSTWGTTATIKFNGNATDTYTIPETIFGRRVLAPVAAYREGSSVVLSSVVRATNNTFTIKTTAVIPTTDSFTVEVVLDAPTVIWSKTLTGVAQVVRPILLKREALSNSIFFKAPGTILKSVATLTGFSGNFVNGVALSNSVLTTVTGLTGYNGYFNIEFGSGVNVGDIVEVLVLVALQPSQLNPVVVAYESSTVEPVPFTGEFTLLTDPQLIAHTKGSGGVDVNPSDFGPMPFGLNSQIKGQPIGLSYIGTNSQSVVMDMPLVASRYMSQPFRAGLRTSLSELLATKPRQEDNLFIAGPNLIQNVSHENIAYALVQAAGRIMLLVLKQTASGNSNVEVTDVAQGALYHLNGFPIVIDNPV